MDDTTKTFVGIDVSQAKLDVYVVPTNDCRQFDHTTAGIKKLIAWLKKLEPELVLFESTGNDEQSLMLEPVRPAATASCRSNGNCPCRVAGTR